MNDLDFGERRGHWCREMRRDGVGAVFRCRRGKEEAASRAVGFWPAVLSFGGDVAQGFGVRPKGKSAMTEVMAGSV